MAERVPFVIPDAAGYLVGWRLWCMSPADELRSLVIGKKGGWSSCVWPARQPLVAHCAGIDPTWEAVPGDRHLCEQVASGGAAPHAGGRCGVWAYKTTQALRPELHRWAFEVIGQVALWGRCVEHELGWRAEYAYPLRLWVRPSYREISDRISRSYRVSVFVYNPFKEDILCG